MAPRLGPPVLAATPLLTAGGVIGWLAGTARPLFGSPWITRIVIWVLVAVLSYVLYRLLRRRLAPKPTEVQSDALGQLYREARSKLSAMGLKGRHLFGTLPTIVVMGPRGSTKTSVVLQSGLDTEHLAGNLYYEGTVARTDSVNLWYHAGHLLVEAGGQMAVEPGRWADLVSKLKPHRGLAQLLGRPQAPRAAVVCYSCEELLTTHDPEAVVAAARNLRQRLDELSEAVGAQIPVYVLFTKADTVEYFPAFAAPLTNREAGELLGWGVPDESGLPSGSYADVMQRRVADGFHRLTRGLAALRLDVLGRLPRGAEASAAYEFPRELAKLSAQATPFLVELCRPAQVARKGPILRGYYFVGLRAVERGVPAQARPAQHRAPPPAVAGATQVLDGRELRDFVPGPEAVQARSHRVPEWVFLRGFFSRVVLSDASALGAAAVGSGLHMFRRAVLGVGLATTAVMALLVLLAFNQDRRLQTELRTAVEEVAGWDRSMASSPPLESLQRLDALRAVTEKLSGYENRRRPLRAVTGLYTGEPLYREARGLYLDRLQLLLLENARAGVNATITRPPSPPTPDEFSRVYEALKVHVEISEFPDSAQPDEFRRILTDQWQSALGVSVDGPTGELIGDQFAFLGSELRFGNPWQASQDPAYISQMARTREYLRANTNDSTVYMGLVRQANRFEPVRFADEILVGVDDVPGAFTRPGWESVHQALEDPNRLIDFDRHVVGDQFFADVDPAAAQAIADAVRRRYVAEYRTRWVDFLESARVESFSRSAASDALQEFQAPASPLIQFLALAREHTDLDEASLRASFQPLGQVVAPDSFATLWSAAAQPYQAAIIGVASAAEAAASQPGEETSSAGTAAVQDANREVLALQAGFAGEPVEAVRVGEAVASLMRAPLSQASRIFGQGPAIQLRQDWITLCAAAEEAFLNRFPFNPDAAVEADPGDVGNFFGESGRFFQFYDDNLDQLPSLSDEYRAFIDAGRALRTVLTDPSAKTMLFQAFASEAAPEVVLSVGTVDRRYTQVERDAQPVSWMQAGEAVQRIALSVPGLPEINFGGGEWAIFRMFLEVERWTELNGAYEVAWALGNGSLLEAEARFNRPETALVLRPDFLRGLRCPGQIFR